MRTYQYFKTTASSVCTKRASDSETIRNELLFQCNVIITRQQDTTVILYANIRIYEEYCARYMNRRRTHTSYRIVSDLNQHWESRAWVLGVLYALLNVKVAGHLRGGKQVYWDDI